MNIEEPEMSATTAAQKILGASGAPSEVQDQLGELIHRYRGELINQALAILGNQEDAEDVVQETFCEALRNPDDLKKVQSLGAWLRTINHGNAVDRLRGRRRDAAKSDRLRAMDPQREATTGGFSTIVLREAVAKAIEALPDRQREAVVLYYWEHLSYDEIATRLDVSSRTVRRLLYEASSHHLYAKLKVYLESQTAPSPLELDGQ